MKKKPARLILKNKVAAMSDKDRAIELCRLRSTSDRVIVDENHRAISSIERKDRVEKVKALQIERDELLVRFRAIPKSVTSGNDLCSAARVSIDMIHSKEIGKWKSHRKLVEETEKFESFRDINDKISKLQSEIENTQSGVWSYRCRIGVEGVMGAFVILAQGDTWAEVCQILQNKIDSK